VIDRLTAALARSRADYTEIRVERTWSTAVTFRGRRLESATRARTRAASCARCTRAAAGASPPYVARPARGDVVRAGELSRAVPGIRHPPRRRPPTSGRRPARSRGDVRGVPIAEKKRLLEAYTRHARRERPYCRHARRVPRRGERVLYVNSQGTILHELRPDVTLSGTAVARRDGTIEKGLESTACAAVGTRCRT